MSDAESVDVALFDLIAADDRQPQAFSKLFGKSGFPRSRPARNDDALWSPVHGCPILISNKLNSHKYFNC